MISQRKDRRNRTEGGDVPVGGLVLKPEQPLGQWDQCLASLPMFDLSDGVGLHLRQMFGLHCYYAIFSVLLYCTPRLFSGMKY